jgi:PAS domain S-box-containing protein
MISDLPEDTYEAGRRITEMYHVFFENAPIGCVLADETGRFELANGAYARIHGRDIRETLDLKYQHFTPKEFEAEDRQQIKELWDTGRSGPFEKTYTRKDGSFVPVRVILGRVFVGGQKMIWSVVEELEPRMSLALYRLMFQSAPVALALCEFDSGRYIDVNVAYATLVGRSIDELLTMSYLDLTPYDEEARAVDVNAKRELKERGQAGPVSVLYEKKKKEGDSAEPIKVKVNMNCVLIRWQNQHFIWSLCYPESVRVSPDRPIKPDEIDLPAVFQGITPDPLEPPPDSEKSAD